MKFKSGSLIYRFASVFLLCCIVILGICAYSNYNIQTRIYKEQQIRHMQEITDYLGQLMTEDGEEFVALQEYLLAHGDTLRIPMEVRDWADTEAAFHEKFHETYPGYTLEDNLDYTEMTDELQALNTVYNYKYWMNLLYSAMEKFDIEYAYYIVPLSETKEIIYLLDVVPDEFEENGTSYRVLNMTYPHSVEEHPNLWKTWEMGKFSGGFDEYNNEYGHTYVYYTPLVIEEEQLGLLAAEVSFDTYNKAVMTNTLRQMLFITITLVGVMAIMLIFINRRYIRKLENLSENVKTYAQDKDPAISGVIEKGASGNDEISALASQTAAMIIELDSYMKNLVSTTKELAQTKEQAEKLNLLANMDSLTGIRNKTAYDDAVQKLEWKRAEGLREFGVAMIDLNYLKIINDTYGHDKGNLAIINICNLICKTFSHSPVFRLGGDEFVVLLSGHDYDYVDELVKCFNKEQEELAARKELMPWEAVSAAIGYALYDPKIDSCVEDVFKRSDDAMYRRKKEMHARREK